jgi:metallo-beta-lactamase family protein
MHIRFLGGVGTVTGSKFLITSGKTSVLIDCGLYQGFKQYRLRNRQDFPVDPKSIDAIILTHAHLDHTGYLPVLTRKGFCGPIYCTTATKDITRIILKDAAYLQDEDARYLNHHGLSKHKPAMPLFNRGDVDRALKLFEVRDCGADHSHNIGDEFRYQCYSAGHILGSTFIRLDNGEKSILFSGDIGRPIDILTKGLQPPPMADYLVLESTYGGRSHSTEDPLANLENIVKNTIQRGGTILIPSFAVARAQKIIYLLYQLRQHKRIPSVPIYLNSPMAENVNDVYATHADQIALSQNDLKGMFQMTQNVGSAEESMHLNLDKTPKIIIAGSGMATGGRIIHHLKHYGPDPKHCIFFIGFQAPGTRGEALVNGCKKIKIHGEYVPINAKIEFTDALSSHGDEPEIVDWVKQIKTAPKRTFLVHGEPKSADNLRLTLKETLNWNCHVPEFLERVELD